MSEVRNFTCQQCGYQAALDTVFNYEVCPKCQGNLFPDDYVPSVDWKARTEKAEADLSAALKRAETAEAEVGRWKAEAERCWEDMAGESL